MKTLMVVTLLGMGILMMLAGCEPPQKSRVKNIGIIVPIEHKAMDEIVAGFTETLRAISHDQLQFHIKNAQGDLNLQRAIIQQMRNEHYDMVVPIGTDATQMTVANIPQQPIVSLAAGFSQQDREKISLCHIAVVHDEISSEKLITFIHLVYPAITRIVLIHSTADKIFPEVDAAIISGKQLGIDIKRKMINNLIELYGVAKAIPSDAQAIFILKDSLVVSGISTLKTVAAKMHVPLITSDQGSVEEGAAFALGVHEREIGVQGAYLAHAILAGKQPCDLPIAEMTRLTVFVNRASLSEEQQSLLTIQSTVNKLHYQIEIS